MFRSKLFLLVVVAGICLAFGRHAEAKPRARRQAVSEEEDSVPKQQPKTAQSSHRVRRNVEGTEAWGYVDVRPGAHMFYWLYQSVHPEGYLSRPLIIWLQGGPGASSCGYGNFELIGPLNLDLQERNTTWVKEANLLFIDNPVGAGYSYVDNLGLLTTDVQGITNDLTAVITTFMEYFPQFRTIPIYVFGQSYGGKMGSHFARHLYYEVQAGRIDLNIAGFAMGNSWISPIDSTVTWGPFLYQMSLVDENGMDEIQAEAQKAQDAIDAGNWELATDYWASTEWVVIDKTHGVDFYNVLKFVDYWGRGQGQPSRDTEEMLRGLTRHANKLGLSGTFRPSAKAGDPLDDLMNGPIREKLGIIPANVIWGAQSDAVFNAQTGDFMKPVVDVVDNALINTTLQVIVYQGQLDVICDTVGAMDWVRRLTWDQINNYYSANRQWFVNADTRQTEMFVKAHDRFKFYWVLGGGHSLAKDNGDTAYRMLQRIIGNLDV